ncbi:MAG: S8 family serine peptidase [Planctomycetota bacterium]|nr:MAG: S8 family serine peptidase [Planctomycetota bacterium]
MADRAKKLLALCLVACVIATLIAANAADASEKQQTDKILQPQGLNAAGIYTLRELDPNLTGFGTKFAVICRSITYINGEPQNDYRPSTEHDCLKNRQFSFYGQDELPAGISPHSTAICSILFGKDHEAFNPRLGQFYYQGAAPQAEADIYEFWHFLANNIFAGSAPDADILTASFGKQFEDWWTRGIESMAEQFGLIVVAGIGNGSHVYDPLLYPGAGANVIGVGVVDSVNTENLPNNLSQFCFAYPEHSSCGPTDDGRCKPDIVAPGNCLAADANEPNHYKPTGNWSSFSTPIVAGTIGLLVQKAKQDSSLNAAISPYGGNCVIKALLVNSATKLPYWHKGRLGTDDDHQVPLDYIQGSGMLNAVGAYKHLIAGIKKPGDVPTIGWDLNHLQKDKKPLNFYRVTVAEPADKFITATLVWNKHYTSAYPFEPLPEKDANLRLELWAVNKENPENYYLLDYSDSKVDNLEHIYCRTDPNYTNYEIAVFYSDLNEANKPEISQRYGIAWSVSVKQEGHGISWYDLNSDGIVDELDFNTLLNNFMVSIKAPESYQFGDINTDGKIDAEDFQILREHISTQADRHTAEENELK